MIPKKIHYCWFGGNPLPEDAKRYIESWKKYCPDYEIKEWNEGNFDLDRYPYVREAYDNRKFAFVSDVARLYALYTEGGIYMDTDVEVLKPLDEFLKYAGVSGFESSTQIPTGLMASRDLHPLVKEWLDEYEGIHFVKEDGSFDLTTNVTRITNSCLKHGFIPNGELQTVADYTFFPSDYFCPKSHETGIISCTENTVAIHHFAGSWVPDEAKEVVALIHAIHAKVKIKFLAKIICIFAGAFRRIKKYGIKKALKHWSKRLVK
ncbi:MAG: glycosyl transferase [Treponema sp.]|nr:glycosyl transferase [Treponema sp.]